MGAIYECLGNVFINLNHLRLLDFRLHIHTLTKGLLDLTMVACIEFMLHQHDNFK